MTPAALLASQPLPTDDWEGRHRIASLPSGAITLASLASDRNSLAALVARKAAQARGGDDRLGCAYLVGELAWELGRLLGGFWLAGWRVGALDPQAVGIAPRDVAWQDGDETRIASVVDLVIDPQGIDAGGQGPADLARVLKEALTSLVAALSAQTGLGAPAQWRLVADGATAALLQAGRTGGALPEAITLCRAIAGDRASPLHNRQIELIEVSCPGRPEVTDWFRLRGGCCRFYTATGESGEYCSTCVHRDRDDQIARLSDYLRQTLAQGH